MVGLWLTAFCCCLVIRRNQSALQLMTSQASGISSQESQSRKKTDAITQMYYFQHATLLNNAFSKTERVTWRDREIQWNEWPITALWFWGLAFWHLAWRGNVISSSVKYGGKARKGGFETSDDLFINYSSCPMSNDLTPLPENNTLLHWSRYAAQTRTEQPIFCRSYCKLLKYYFTLLKVFFFFVVFFSLPKFHFCPCSQ